MCVTVDIVYNNCGCVLNHIIDCRAQFASGQTHAPYRTPDEQHVDMACKTCIETSKQLAEYLTKRLEPKKVGTEITERWKALRKTQLWETLL